jgi:hypothetical protein
LARLEEERAFLLGSLADLEREREVGDLDDDDYRTLRDDYTGRAAEVLRAIDERRAAIEASHRPRRPGRVIATAAAVVVLAVGAGIWVAHSSGSRKPGQTISGNANVTDSASPTTAGSGSTTATTSPATKCIGEISSDALGALKCFQTVLAKAPNDPVALTYRGWALTLAAESATNPTQVVELRNAAESSLKRAVQVAPKLGDPKAFLAILYTNAGECDDARQQVAALDALGLPSDSQIMQLVDTQLRPQLANGACPPG